MHWQPIRPGANRVWEHFHHEADVGVRGIGESPAAAFEQAALAMTAVIADPACVLCRERVEVDCAAPDLELLLIARHAPAVEVKGATYTALAVREDAPGQWRAQCVIDV